MRNIDIDMYDILNTISTYLKLKINDMCMYVFTNLHCGEHACKATGTKV